MFAPRPTEWGPTDGSIPRRPLGCAVGTGCQSEEYKQATKSRAKALTFFEKELAGIKPEDKIYLCRYHYAMLFHAKPETRVSRAYDDLPAKVKKLLEKELNMDKESMSKNIDILWRAADFVLPEEFNTSDSHANNKPHSPSVPQKYSERSRCPDSYLANAKAIILTPKKPISKLLTMQSQTGKGGFGSVWISTYKPKKKQVAVKKVDNKTSRDQRSNLTEIAYLAKLAHPNIMTLEGVLCDPKESKLYIVMEYLEGGTIEHIIPEKMPHSYISYVTKEILMGLDFMHRQLIGHCDIKPDNIMMKFTGEIKLGTAPHLFLSNWTVDFGLCCEFFTGPRRSMRGSPFWIAPEMILGQPYDMQIDIWALGIILTELLGLCTAFAHPVQHLFVVGTEGYQKHIPNIGTSATDFLKKCLQANPKDRPTAAQLLQHDWMKEVPTVAEYKEYCQDFFMRRRQQNLLTGLSM